MTSTVTVNSFDQTTAVFSEKITDDFPPNGHGRGIESNLADTTTTVPSEKTKDDFPPQSPGRESRDLESNLENTIATLPSEKIKDYTCGVCKKVMRWDSPEFFTSHVECQKIGADGPILRFRVRPTDYEDRKCDFKIIPSDGPSIETVVEAFKKENRRSIAYGPSTKARVLDGPLVIPPNSSWIALYPKN